MENYGGVRAVVDISPSVEISFREKRWGDLVLKHLVELQYFNEGAANVLFRISIPEEENSLDAISGTLLRLRKTTNPQNFRSTQAAPPPFVSAEEIFKYIYGTIGLDKNLILQHRVVTVSRELIRNFNYYLAGLEGYVEKRRIGSRIGEEVTSALLVEDMTSFGPSSVTFELKPKWLTVSPGVENPWRCRTCAWHVKNNVSRQKRYCPHALISMEEDEVRKQVKLLLSRSTAIASTEVEDEITRYFCDNERGFRVLDTIRKQQEAHDSHGVLSWIKPNNTGDPESQGYFSYVENLPKQEPTRTRDLECAMTLRDCTLFIKFTRLADGGFDVVAKIGDLDPKIASPLKLAKWAADEHDLRKGGYYHGKETRDSSSPTADEVCIHWKESKSMS
jgi:inositol-pentakisphosphate 2-kinase